MLNLLRSRARRIRGGVQLPRGAEGRRARARAAQRGAHARARRARRARLQARRRQHRARSLVKYQHNDASNKHVILNRKYCFFLLTIW